MGGKQIMELTREQAIEEHRKMWNWIADKIERFERVVSISEYKRMYCYSFGMNDILSSCFMCEYTNAICRKCPLDWGNKEGVYAKCLDKYMFGDGMGIYELCKNAETWQEQAKLARQIANLPERNN